jgi:hypothetical protein
MDDQTPGAAVRAEALPEAARADAIEGEFVTETFEYDGGRQVTVYVPPDGQRISQWGKDLEAADVPSTMIVGVQAPTS